jgi:hypothetical protein
LSTKQFPGPEEHAVQHFLGQFPCARILLSQLNVSTPKRAAGATAAERQAEDGERLEMPPVEVTNGSHR